jgi:hypothetical protein
LIHLLVDAIHLISGFQDFAALHFRVLGYGRVSGLRAEGGQKSQPDREN